MEILGTKFCLTLGGWRLNLAFNIEEVQDEAPKPAPCAHERLYPRDLFNVR